MMKIPNNLYLVGPMGAGKSTVGRHLARGLEKEFVDCDKELEARTGVNIPLIFELEGEAGFRKREKTVLHEQTERDGIVLATGGGAVIDPDNRQRLRSRGFVVYLHAPLEVLVQRTAKDRNRPLLQTEDPQAFLAELMEVRDPLYREVADLVIMTNHRTARHAVRQIMKELESL